MAALIAAAQDSGYPAEIALVLSNRPQAPGLALARQRGVACVVLDHRAYGPDRDAFERGLQAILDEHAVDLVCLAGFMRLFTAPFVQRWQGRMLNIHPSLLPSFRGLDPHGQALRAGVKITGATVHFVVAETDAGPIIAQGAVPVLENDTEETLEARVLAIEHRLYPLALRLVAEGSARIVEGRCVIATAGETGDALLVPPDQAPMPQPSRRVPGDLQT